MAFPVQRPRRLRRSTAIRYMVRETSIAPQDFILPLFVIQGSDTECKEPIGAMPGCFHLSPETAAREAKTAFETGVPAVLLFGLPEKKDPQGSGAWADDGAVQLAVKAIKQAVPEMCVICDLCMCEYTDHGHCGIIEGDTVDNDRTLALLVKAGLSQARAGADIIAPSDMMDGRIQALRTALDENDFTDLPIMAYSAKYSSAFYGPFREAADSTPSFGNRKTYQMDPPNAREAVKEMALDVEEGADIIMVKPALPYLDIIKEARDNFDLPVAAYQVSGEYSMIKLAGQQGLLDETQAMMESLVSIKRAGADMIITYFAVEAAKILKHQYGKIEDLPAGFKLP